MLGIRISYVCYYKRRHVSLFLHLVDRTASLQNRVVDLLRGDPHSLCAAPHALRLFVLPAPSPHASHEHAPHENENEDEISGRRLGLIGLSIFINGPKSACFKDILDFLLLLGKIVAIVNISNHICTRSLSEK